MRPYSPRVMAKERIARAQPTTVHGEHLFVRTFVRVKPRRTFVWYVKNYTRTFVRLCAAPDTKIPYNCEDYVKKLC